MVTDKDQSTYTDKLTLDEIAENDMQMLRDAIKNASKYTFGMDMKKAILFVRDCIDRTLKSLGITSPQPPPNCNSKAARARLAAKIDKEMADRQVKIEYRNKYTGADQWRCGVYIYQRDELVAFISDVFTTRRTEFDPVNMKITGEKVGYMVVTNARTDDSKRIFLMPATALKGLH